MAIYFAPQVASGQSNSSSYPFQGLTPCANNLQFPNINLFSQDGSVTPVVRTYRTGHEILTSGSIARLAWINQLFNGSVTNSYALEAGVQLSNTRSADLSATTITRLRFNGATSITVQPNQVVISDPIYLDVEPGQFLFVRSCLTSTAASNNWPTGPWCFQSNEGIATGNQVTNLSQSFSNFTVGVAPILISSQSSDGRWLAAYGDSILDGSSDVINSRGFFPLWQSAARIKGTRNSNPGELITNFLSRIPLRFQNTSGATHALFEYGTNDVANGGSLSTIQSNLIASWRILWKMNQAVYQTTILPRASSTDGWTTAQNQTITNASQETVRTSLNDWLRAGAPVTASATSPFFVPASIGAANSLPCPYLSRVLDWCQAVEVDTSNQITANGGRWIVGSTLRSGTATGGSTTSITDIAAGFTSIVTSYGGAVAGCFVRITAGAGAGQTNWIIGATSTSINLLNTWSVAANNTSVYEIIDTATRDAVHPSVNTHLRIANWLTSNLAALP